MFKKIAVFVLSAVLVFSAFTAASAMTVRIDGTETDITSEIWDDVAFVPVRSILEAFGAEINWYGSTQTVVAWISTTKVTFKNNTDYITVNGEVKELGAHVRVIDGTTFVPIRAVAEAIGCSVSYDDESKAVVIERGELPWTIRDVFGSIMSMKGWEGDVAFSIGDTVEIDGISCASVTAYGEDGAIGQFAVSYDFADIFELSGEDAERIFICR